MTELDCTAQEVEIVSHPFEHSGVVEWAGVSDGLKKKNPPESLENMHISGPGSEGIRRGTDRAFGSQRNSK